jgi:hypothetical protein
MCLCLGRLRTGLGNVEIASRFLGNTRHSLITMLTELSWFLKCCKGVRWSWLSMSTLWTWQISTYKNKSVWVRGVAEGNGTG